MRRAFAGLGLAPFDVPLDAARPRPPRRCAVRLGCRREGERARGLAAGRRRPPPLVILNGHIDVVSPEPGALWSGEPYDARIDGEWMYGRGAGDMKAGLAAMVGAVRGLQRLGLTPRGRVQLQSVVEEECTGNGALACVLAGQTADAAILTEPTKHAIWTAQVGVLWFQVRVLGAPAHAGLADADGADAIQASYTVIEALRGLEAELNAAPPPLFADHPHPIDLNVGMIRGGDGRHGGRRVRDPLPARDLPRRTVADLKARVEQTVAAVAARPELARHRVEVLYEGFQREGYELARDAPLVTALVAACTRATGQSPPLTRPPRRPTRGRSSSTVKRPRSASGRSRRTSTASTSACTCPR